MEPIASWAILFYKQVALAEQASFLLSFTNQCRIIQTLSILKQKGGYVIIRLFVLRIRMQFIAL